MQTPYAAHHNLKADEGASSLYCVLLRPHSKGTMRLVLVDPSVPADMQLRIPRRHARMACHAQSPAARPHQLTPMVQPTGETDEELDAYIRLAARTILHYASSPRMAPESEGGVVDDELRVCGVRGLRVADASVFPTVSYAGTDFDGCGSMRFFLT